MPDEQQEEAKKLKQRTIAIKKMIGESHFLLCLLIIPPQLH